RPGRLDGVTGADVGARLRARVVAGDRHVAGVRVVFRPIADTTHRHLVFLPYWFADGVAALAHVLFIHGPIGAIVQRHLVFLHHWLHHRVTALAHVGLVDRLAGAV